MTLLPSQKLNLTPLDSVCVSGFKMFSVVREKCNRPSGGVAILVKEQLCHHFKVIDSSNENFIICKLKQNLVGKSILLACVYIPPENSKFATATIFDEIETKITECLMKVPILLRLIRFQHAPIFQKELPKT